MDDQSRNQQAGDWTPAEAVKLFRTALEQGRDWPTCLLETIATWTAPEEVFRGRRLTYFLLGEAFDWLLLAERLCAAVARLVPKEEVEELLFTGRFPSCFDASQLGPLLGGDKNRGQLNFFYGVTVEEALQLATELEVHKHHASNGVHYLDDYTDEAFARIYGSSRGGLLRTFRQEMGRPNRRSASLAETKEFTYWLFKYRLNNSDKARIASDTRKGLLQLHRMREASGVSPLASSPLMRED